MIASDAYQSITPRLLQICAVTLLLAQSAWASDGVGDAQIQARDLITRSAVRPLPVLFADLPQATGAASAADASAQARGLLVGASGFGAARRGSLARGDVAGAAVPDTGRAGHRASPDAQALAQRVILGLPRNHENVITRHRLAAR
jgi:hypothetical protein